MYRTANSGLVVLMGLLIAGCQPRSSTPKVPETPAVTAPSMTPEARDPRKVAVEAKDAMFKALSGKLMEAIGQGGPAAAIEVCSQTAPSLASKIGDEFGVKIGRTSFKLRNPRNTPPEWAQTLIVDRPTEPRFVELPDNHLGALFPIQLKVQCLACHGPKDQISAEVQAQLDRRYPEDQATGFNEGDLRGWFWVDVPVSVPHTPLN